jgi:hypothetical protein
MASRERTFVIDLTPNGFGSCVLLDGLDISGLLEGVAIRASVHEGPTIELLAAPGAAAVNLQLRLPEARVLILQRHTDDQPEG